MVYVDVIRPTLKNEHWPYLRGCHLVADAVIELHQFAQRLGLQRAWFQGRSDLPHYDLTVGMRARAIQAGALEIDAQELVRRIRQARSAKRVTKETQ